jgi:hypothetical protein
VLCGHAVRGDAVFSGNKSRRSGVCDGLAEVPGPVERGEVRRVVGSRWETSRARPRESMTARAVAMGS